MATLQIASKENSLHKASDAMAPNWIHSNSCQSVTQGLIGNHLAIMAWDISLPLEKGNSLCFPPYFHPIVPISHTSWEQKAGREVSWDWDL